MPKRVVKPHPAPGFGASLIEARKAKGLLQGEAARAVGVNQTRMSMWERDQSFPLDANLAKVCAFYGIDPPLPPRNEAGRASRRTAQCPECGKDFPVFYGERFCSRRCAGASLSKRFAGKNSPNWKGGRTVEPNGYVKLHRPDHPRADGAGYVREHRLVMEAVLGRYLEPHETVHHKNGDTSDNEVENLELRVGRHGKGASHAHCATCTCFDH